MNNDQQIFNPFAEPVDHILERAGFCSNRAFKAFAKNHKIEIISGETRQSVNHRAALFDNDSDTLLIDGTKIELPAHLYIIFNKPVGAVCSRTSDSHPTVFSLLPPPVKNNALFEHLHIAGRLDEQSRGLVFLTTNGALSNFFISPQSHLPKQYKVVLQNACTPAAQNEYIKHFCAGINLAAQKKAPAFTTKPAKLEFDAPDQCTVTITEGKFHQVRRMFEALNNTVIDLQRTIIGNISLPPNLPQGECALFTREEISNLLQIKEN
mgnify:FL=1